MDAAQTRKLRIFKAGNRLENIGLRAVLHLGLEADDIVKRAQLVVAAQLHNGVGLDVGLMRIGQAHGFHRAMAQGLAAAFGHHFDRQAAVEIAGRFALVEFGFVGGQQRVDESVVLCPCPSGS